MVKKMWYTYTMGYHPAARKKKVLPTATTWMDPENIKLRHLFTHCSLEGGLFQLYSFSEALPSAWEMDSSKATIWFTVLNTLLSGTQTYGLAWVSSYLFWEWESTFIVTISCAGSGSLEKPPIGSHKVACSRMFLEPISLVRSLNGLATPWPLGPSQDLRLHSSHFVSLGSELFTTIGSTSRCLRTTPSLGKLSFHSSFKETKWKRDQAVQQSCRKPSSC